ncbi:hypothetical protein [Rhodococcus sp. I2R]|uniref:hypothetical protein n=1 Tax=Rhodococcus sp. I2R TaxID=2855445 RepID=UPI001E459F18|nr:hypothetical protein [Rhodococcus sp. I2R]MCC8929013.1 hypothetical protein [Rhodococcus sp. I2R]
MFVSFAPTVGVNKDGDELFVIDPLTGTRTASIDDKVAEDVAALTSGSDTTATSRWIPVGEQSSPITAVPIYFDDRPVKEFEELLQSPELKDFESVTLGELIERGDVIAKAGHGSPSADMRTGLVPYIKVSDIRAGQVNINPTNRVSEIVARKFWRGPESGLSAYDLVTPIRTSKNIGDFAVLMPGQERIVLTKEMLVLHASEVAEFDNFYLLWAMSLKAVRRQWDRVVFMQTNREDVGQRFNEIRIPIAKTRDVADMISAPFRNYYIGSTKLREDFLSYLTSDGRHHIFMSSAEAVAEDAEEETGDAFGC